MIGDHETDSSCRYSKQGHTFQVLPNLPGPPTGRPLSSCPVSLAQQLAAVGCFGPRGGLAVGLRHLPADLLPAVHRHESMQHKQGFPPSSAAPGLPASVGWFAQLWNQLLRYRGECLADRSGTSCWETGQGTACEA